MMYAGRLKKNWVARMFQLLKPENAGWWKANQWTVKGSMRAQNGIYS